MIAFEHHSRYAFPISINHVLKVERMSSTRPSELLSTHRDEVRRIVAAHRGLNPRVFGSVAKGVDTPTSDLDILIDPDKGMTLFDIGAIRVELSNLLSNVPLDVVTPHALPDAWRDKVIAEAKSI